MKKRARYIMKDGLLVEIEIPEWEQDLLPVVDFSKALVPASGLTDAEKLLTLLGEAARALKVEAKPKADEKEIPTGVYL